MATWPGWRSFGHGVGSFSILPIGTYAASAISHQPRATAPATSRQTFLCGVSASAAALGWVLVVAVLAVKFR